MDEASAPSWALVVAVWTPVAAVTLWFMTRLFRGFWPDQPPARPEEDGLGPAAARHEPVDTPGPARPVGVPHDVEPAVDPDART